MPHKAKKKKPETKKDSVINSRNYNFDKFKIRTILMSQNATNQPKSTVKSGYMCPRGFFGPPAVTLMK